jgi:hypothetical protein
MTNGRSLPGNHAPSLQDLWRRKRIDLRYAIPREDHDDFRWSIVWWADLLWGFWNGLTAWIVLIVHVFGGWKQFPFYNTARSGSWYDFGFLLGAGSPILGTLGGGRRSG